MTECLECGANDWTYYHCEYKDGSYLIEACNNCTAVKPDGLIEQLMEVIKEEMEIEFTPESDTEKLKWIEEKVDKLIEMYEDEPNLEDE